MLMIDNYHGRIENMILSQEDKGPKETVILILSIENDGLESGL